ncbi:transposase family protein, partial [Thiolapillus sp.]|uniref:transposase family protein n=1 Tax=Thiolapillus sp. TaxID=2017437 RepID=UPI003AF43D1C
MTRTAGAPIGCQRPSRFWGLGCPKIYHEVEDTLVSSPVSAPWAEPGSGFTAMFEALVIDWLKEASTAAVSRLMGLSWNAI